MNKNTRNGLIALVGAAFAFWKWGMNDQQRAQVKDQVSAAGKKVMDKVPQELKDAGQQLADRVSGKKKEEAV